MKRLFKNASLIALGITLGFVASTFADMEKIMAYKDNVTSIFINGDTLKTQDTPISYQNRLYVPLRAISENMDMNVQYDKANKSVFITQKPSTKEEELAKQAKLYEEAKAEIQKLKAQNVEDARKEEISKKQNIDYKALPVTYKDDKFYMTLKMIVRDNADDESEFYFDVKNEDEIGYVVDPFSAKLNYNIDEREFEINADDVNIGHIDTRALSSLDSGYDKPLYLTLKEIPKDVHNATLSYNIYKVGESNNIKKVIMPIKF